MTEFQFIAIGIADYNWARGQAMTYCGHIKNGVAVLTAPVDLPDGTPVVVAIERADSRFWRNQSLEDLAAEHKITAIKSLDELASDWPAEDSIDEFLALVRKART